MSVDWPKHEPTLRRLAKRRNPSWSASEIAQEIGYPCTRNAVIGKASRMGVSISKKATYRRKKPEPMVKPFKGNAAQNKVPRSYVPIPPQPLPKSSILDGATLDVGLLELHENICKWPSNSPLKGEETLFCGHTTEQGQPYCATHKERALK